MTRILYVEDNDDNVYMLKMHFELLYGFEVMTRPFGRDTVQPDGLALSRAAIAAEPRSYRARF
jgi:hypothetical protein